MTDLQLKNALRSVIDRGRKAPETASVQPQKESVRPEAVTGRKAGGRVGTARPSNRYTRFHAAAKQPHQSLDLIEWDRDQERMGWSLILCVIALAFVAIFLGRWAFGTPEPVSQPIFPQHTVQQDGPRYVVPLPGRKPRQFDTHMEEIVR